MRFAYSGGEISNFYKNARSKAPQSPLGLITGPKVNHKESDHQITKPFRAAIKGMYPTTLSSNNRALNNFHE